MARPSDGLSRMPTAKSTYNEPNDLGLMESNVEHDIESGNSDEEAQPNLSPLKTNQSRMPQNQIVSTLSRTLSRVRTSDTLEPGPPPDGGLQAWLTAVLVHLVIFNTWGFINSFGIFQSYYVNTANLGSPSAVSWIGTIQVFIIFNIGAFSGRATDAGYFKLVFTLGTAITMVGFFSLAQCTKYWQVFLAQGVCIGIGYGLVFVPSLTILSTYFLNNRSTALGIATMGSGTGGLVVTAISQQLLPTAGFVWTIRTIGFVQLFAFVVCILFLKPRLPPRKGGPVVEWKAFREIAYTLYLISGFLFFWGVYIGFFYVTSYARTQLGASQTTAINLLLAMNGVGVVARPIINTTANYLGPINVLFPFIIASGVMGIGWIGINSLTGLWVFTVIYGCCAAGLQGLWPVVLTSLTSDPKRQGTRSGMGFAFVGFAVLTGSPIGGALIELRHGDYLACQIFAGLTMFASAVFLGATRWAVLKRRRLGWTWFVKV